MITAEISNCNNVVSATVQLRKNYLNIRYAMNGVGKSTIAEAIKCTSTGEGLPVLRPFDGHTEPTCTLSEVVPKVLLFNEEFVDTIVFQQSEVIQNSFEVFIRTPDYQERQESINTRLKNLHVNVRENTDLQRIVQTGRTVLSRFTLTMVGKFRQQGLIKSLTDSESIFQLPIELQRFQPLMDKPYNVDWVSWKHDGSKYDDNGICPFCTVDFSEEYESEKKKFTASYTKSNVKNIVEMLSYFNDVKDFMDDENKEKLYQCIKGTKEESEIQLWVKRFYDDLEFLVDRLTRIAEFNSYHARSEDISALDEQLRKLVIDVSDLRIFNNQRVIDLVESVNQKIDVVLHEIDSLKSDVGLLKGLVESSKQRAIADINDFLSTAGISYRIEIKDESEGVATTILKYVSKTDDLIDVDNIKLHLSWGERNAFALVLFMRYALSQEPDIIILDDPISSFDSNKKYAILNRLFSSRMESFFRKTVLMFTHDLQPIIDCLVNDKPRSESVSACFLQSKEGVISEEPISGDDVKSLPKLLAISAKNQDLNGVHRIASLRKLFEHTPESNSAKDSAYDLLSSLLHGRTVPTLKDGTELTAEQIASGEEFIRKYIIDFKYTYYATSVFTRENLLKIFNEETNSYSRLQVFRVLLDLLDLRPRIEDPLLKYIDEQLHVENDYIFGLDFMKYDIVPDFVIPKCCEYLRTEHLIA